MDKFRQTGRTIRMLEEALAIVEEKKRLACPITPVVIFANKSQVEYFKTQAAFVSFFMLDFEEAFKAGYIDQHSAELWPRGIERIWVDHSVIEVHFPQMVQTLHQYDLDFTMSHLSSI